MNDYGPAAAAGSFASTTIRYIEELDSDPSLWANVYGTGIGGTYTRAPGSGPFENLEFWITSARDLKFRMATDGFSTTTNHGIFLTANPSLLVSQVYFEGDITPNPFMGNLDPVPLPTDYLADYLGTRDVTYSQQFYLQAGTGVPGDPLLRASFVATTLTIAPAPVPEPGAATLAFGAVASLCIGGRLVRRWKRRRHGEPQRGDHEPAQELPPSLA